MGLQCDCIDDLTGSSRVEYHLGREGNRAEVGRNSGRFALRVGSSGSLPSCFEPFSYGLFVDRHYAF